VNNTITSITSAILGDMQSFSIDKDFFELVVHNRQWKITICQRVRLVAETHEDLLELLSLVAPVRQKNLLITAKLMLSAQIWDYFRREIYCFSGPI
jgi:hypothetical protein